MDTEKIWEALAETFESYRGTVSFQTDRKCPALLNWRTFALYRVNIIDVFCQSAKLWPFVRWLRKKILKYVLVHLQIFRTKLYGSNQPGSILKNPEKGNTQGRNQFSSIYKKLKSGKSDFFRLLFLQRKSKIGIRAKMPRIHLDWPQRTLM